jgi:fermentation-respiration switch protein FrsA (DUF1100 family)
MEVTTIGLDIAKNVFQVQLLFPPKPIGPRYLDGWMH